MLDKGLVEDVIFAALASGGDFAEVFVENSYNNAIKMVSGEVEEAITGNDYGIGIRIFSGTNAVYAFTNNDSRDNLLKVAGEAARTLQGNFELNTLNFITGQPINRHPILVDLRSKTQQDKVELLKKANRSAKSYDDLISQVLVNYFENIQQVLIANSEGAFVEDERVRTRTMIQAVASRGNEKQTGFHGPGAQMGFELYDKIDIEEYAREAARMAVTMIKADFAPGGKMPVVIDNEFGGVIFHEACGHGLEATSVAKKTSVYADKLGEPIASQLVTAIDDGTIPNGWGSQNYDDEAVPMEKKVLIEKGVLKSYMIDRLNGRRMGSNPTGSGRRQSYRYAPTSRMTNTYIAAGNSSPEEIISATEYGLYARCMGGGSVNPATGEFNFSVREGYLIRDGKIAEPVRGATLIGKGSDVLKKIDLVGNNLGFGEGMCGSISGSVPAGIGQPMIRVSELTVGGRKESEQ